MNKTSVIIALGIAGAAAAGFWWSGIAGTDESDGSHGIFAQYVGSNSEVAGGLTLDKPGEKATSVPALPRDDRVSDIEPDGSIRIDMNGNLVLDSSLRRYLDFYIGLTGDAIHANALKQRLIAEMQLMGVPADLQQEVLDILDNYLAYRGAAQALANRRNGDVDDLVAALDELHDLRRTHLGPDVAEGFFGAEEARLRLMLDRQRILADERLTENERERALAQIDQLLPDYAVETRRRSETVVSTSLKVMEMRQQGVSEEEIQALRLEAYGPEATQRLSQLDEQRSRWQSRLAEYQRQRDLIEQTSGLAPEDRHEELAMLRERLFESEHERRRIRALDRATGDGV